MNLDPNVIAYVAPALCVGARISGWMTFLPMFSHAALPPPVKAGLTIALTVLMYPALGTSVTMTAMPGPLTLAGELGVGMVMGLCMQLVFDGIQMGGQIVGTQLGFSLANMIDPLSQIETTVISVFHQSIALIIFLQMNVHHRLLQALARSYTFIPPGSAFGSAIPAPQLLHAAAGMFLVAIEVAAPVMLSTMLIDVTLAFLSRTSPQLPVMLVGISLKSMVGYAVVGATVVLWPWMLERYFINALNTAEKLLHP